MNGKDVTMRIKIDTVLGDMSKAVTGLQEGLTKGISKIDVGSSIGKSLSKNIQQFKEEYNKFSQLTAGGTEVKFSNSKEAIQSGERLSKLYREIQAQVGSLGDASTASLKKLFPDSFDGRIDQIRGSLNSLQSAMIAIGQKDLKFKEAQAEAQQLEQKLTTLRGQLVDTADQLRAVAEAEKEVGAANIEQEAAEKALEGIKQQAEITKTSFESLKAEFQKKINLNAQSVLKEIDTLDKEITELTAKKEKLLKGGDKAGAAAIQRQIESKQQTKRGKERTHSGLISASAKVGKAKDPIALAEYAKYAGVTAKEQTEQLTKAQTLAAQQAEQTKKMAEAEESVRAAREKSSAATDKQKSAQDALNAANTKNKSTQTEIEKTTKSWEAQKAKVNELSAELEGMRTKLSTKGLSSLKELIPGFDENKLKTTEGIQEIITQLDTMDNKKADRLRQELLGLGKSAEQVEGQVGGIRGAMNQVGDGAKDIQRAASEFDQLKNRIQYFFGITNSIQLFKRAITSALNSVKELDKTMTEAAVVTDFSVGDMWDKLPQYTSEAQKLGVSINSMYQATTLYYQQGLKSNKAMALGVETMKMAKIAAMDSTDATKAMTAALRGFNMELNETSATRVNDVYSQLAAVTAADTNQIATAMEKTASIAASANMEFETTAALLAQIIETTQEAPETAGTAMKTIIARFAEVKNLRASGETLGQDEEGEGIDVNKIQTALRSVGISMEGFFAGTEGLDSILLKLAEKWDILDFETQRYIATMAAGSRQQSRFIAMMSNYKRTTELVGEAQDSAGASQRQFNKTLDSMESKLTRLKNAWDQYLMGLANNEILKFGVDLLSGVLEVINKITDSISGGNGLMKSIVSLISLIAGLNLGKAVLSPVLGGLGTMVGIGGTTVSTSEEYEENGKKMTKTTTKRAPKGERGEGDTFFRRNLTEEEYSNRVHGVVKGDANWKKFKQKQIAANANNPDNVKTMLTSKNLVGIKEGSKEAEALAQTFDETYSKTGDLGKAMDATAEKTAVLGGEIKTANNSTTNFQKNIKTTTFDSRNLGKTIMGVGAAVGALAAIFNALGLEEWAEGFSTASVILFGLGTIATYVFPLMQKGAAGLAAMGLKVSVSWIVVTVVVLALVAAVAALAYVFKRLEETSDVNQLDKLRQRLDDLSAAAERTSEEINKIAEARKNLENMNDTLSSLTKGTAEWKQALMDNNEQVLALLDTYPQLSQYLTRGIDGELIIKQSGFEEITNQKLDAYAATIGAKNLVANQASRKEQEVNTRLMLEETRGMGHDYNWARIAGTEVDFQKRQTGGLTYTEFDEFAARVAEAGYAISDFSLGVKDTERILEEMGKTDVDVSELQYALLEMGTEFDMLSNEIMAAREAEKARMQATIDSVAATSSLVTNSEKFAEVVKQATLANSKDYSADVKKKAEEDLKVLEKTGKKADEDAQNAIYSEYANKMGYGDAAQVRALVESGELSNTQIAYSLATEEENEKLVARMEKLTLVLEELEATSSKSANLVKNLLSEEGKQLTIGDFEQLGILQKDGEGNITGVSDFTESNVARDLNMSKEDVQAMYESLGMSSLKEFVTYLNKQADLAFATYEGSLENLGRRWGKLEDKIIKKTSAAAVQGLSKNADRMALGQIDSSQISDKLSEVQEFLSQTGLSEDKQQYLFETFANSDWSSAEELDQVSTIWSQELGENTSAMSELFRGIKDLTGATIDLTQAQINAKGFEVSSLVDQIISGTVDQYNLTTEQMNSMLAVLGDSQKVNFKQLTKDTWAYIGDLSGALVESGVSEQERADALEEREQNYEKQGKYTAAAKEQTNGIELIAKDEAIDGAYSQTSAVVDSSLIYIPTLTSEQEAYTGVKEFQGLMKQYISGDSSVSLDALWTAYQEQDYNAQENGMTFDIFKDRVGKERSMVRQYATEMGSNEGFKTDMGENASYGANVTDILDNAGLYINLVNQGNKDLKEHIYGVFKHMYGLTYAVGDELAEPPPIEDMSIELMVQEIQKMKDEYGVGKYSALTSDDAMNMGAGVASSSGVASTYQGHKSELLTEDQQTIATTSYENTVDAMYGSLGGGAFSKEVGDVTKSVDGLANNTEELNRINKIFSVDMAQIYDRVKKLKQGFEQYQDVLVAGKRDMPEYAAAMDKVKTSLASVFGIKVEDINSLLEQGLITQTDIEAIVAGDPDAFSSISKAIKKQALKGILDAEQDTPEFMINAWLEIEGEVNQHTLEAQLRAMGESVDAASEDGQKKLKEMYAKMGKSIEFVVSEDGTTVTAVVKDQDIERAFARAPSSSGGGSGTKWKNEHDKQYNNYEKINQLLREREKIERRYDKLMKNRSVSYKDMLKNQQEQLDNLKEQEVYQRRIQAGKSQEIKDLISSKEGKKYRDYFAYDEKTGRISIDWEKVNKLKGEKGEGFDEFLSKLEGLRDQWQDSQDALEEIEDNTDELRQRGKDDYFDLENQIKDALITDRQKEIDKLSDINDSINDTNSKILESMQEQIDEYRQNRDNEKTEEELADKQRRLAYLQQDTSGANATEILKLQKEIEEGQESYTDQLIDQKISELQKQNDQAAEQRERQITLLEDQLRHYEESGAVWDDVYKLMNSSDSFLSDGALNPDGPLGNLLKENENFAGMSKLGQIDWWQEISTIFANAILYSKTGRRAQEGETIRFQDAEGNWHEGVADKNGNITVNGQTFTGVHQNEKGKWVTDEKQGETETKQEEKTGGSGNIASLPSSTRLSASEVKKLQSGLNELLEDGQLKDFNKLDVDGAYGPLTKAAVKKLQSAIGTTVDGIWGPNTQKAFGNSSLKAYKTGGLADFTGPAWLDGTKSKPEYILNADQTKAFFTLVDILSGLTAGTAKSTEKTGDTSFDIDINVESIGSDYDVEQIASKIKSLINEDARYRNNNAINLMR